MSDPGSGPVSENNRAEILDVLRGFALLGILVSHVPTFSGYEFLPADRQVELDGPVEWAWRCASYADLPQIRHSPNAKTTS